MADEEDPECDELDRMVNAIQDQINKEEEKEYSKTLLDHYRDPRNIGRLEFVSAYAKTKSNKGHTMELFLRIKDGIIVEATFWTDGCGPTIACGSALTEMIKGKSTAYANDLTFLDLVDYLDGMPKNKYGYAQFLIMSLKEALMGYSEGEE